MNTTIAAILISLTFIYSQDEVIAEVTKVNTVSNLHQTNSSIYSMSLGGVGVSYINPYGGAHEHNPANQNFDSNFISYKATGQKSFYDADYSIEALNNKMNYGFRLNNSSYYLIYSYNNKKIINPLPRFSNQWNSESFFTQDSKLLSHIFTFGYKNLNNFKIHLGLSINKNEEIYSDEYSQYAYSYTFYDVGFIISKEFILNDDIKLICSSGYSINNFTNEETGNFHYNDLTVEDNYGSDFDDYSGDVYYLAYYPSISKTTKYGSSIKIDFSNFLSIRVIGEIKEDNLFTDPIGFITGNDYYGSIDDLVNATELGFFDTIYIRYGTRNNNSFQGYGIDYDFNRLSIAVNYSDNSVFDQAEVFISFKL